MKILIADDEAPARLRLARLLEEIDGVEAVAEAANGEAAIRACRTAQPDVVLLDIRMPGMDGLEAARHLSGLPRPPAVIFTTAYETHALEAFEAQAVDYLLKPVRRERLAQALERARRPTRAQLAALAEPKRRPEGRTHLSAVINGNVKLLPMAEVLYFRADQKYVSAYHEKGELLIEDTLKALEAEFGDRFVRVHRNALVARSAIAGLERRGDGIWLLRLQGTETRIEISRRRLPCVRRLLRS